MIKFEDIKIGDEVYFESKSQNNHELYWRVIEKIDQTKQLIVKLDEMGQSDQRYIIRVNEIIRTLN